MKHTVEFTVEKRNYFKAYIRDRYRKLENGFIRIIVLGNYSCVVEF
jgi:hypothetical protein